MEKDITDINYFKVSSYIEKRRPRKEIRNEIDLGFKFANNAYELFEKRPLVFAEQPDSFGEFSFAKIKFVKSKKIWKLYWKRASGNWEQYEPLPESTNLDSILECIDQDDYGCFHG